MTIHLEGQNEVEFDEEEDLQGVLERGTRPTMLTDWFELNLRDASARDILNMDIPSHYVWMKKRRDPRSSLETSNPAYDLSHSRADVLRVKISGVDGVRGG